MGIVATSLTNRLTKPFVRLSFFQKFQKCTKKISKTFFRAYFCQTRLGRPVVRCGHSPFCYNGRFLRATNHQPRTTSLFSDSMRLRRDELTIVLRPCAIRHKFRLCTKFRRPFWPVRCRPEEGAGRLPKRTAVAGRPLAVPYGIAARR